MQGVDSETGDAFRATSTSAAFEVATNTAASAAAKPAAKEAPDAAKPAAGAKAATPVRAGNSRQFWFVVTFAFVR